jgi:Mrp family chromosome partitioning ATPase
MSAIDNAFIRAYTLDTAVAAAPATRDFDDRSTFTSASEATNGLDAAAPNSLSAGTVAEAERIIVKTSAAAERSSRRAAGPSNPIAVAQSGSQRLASSAALPRRTPIATAAKSPISAPTISPTPAVVQSVVPSPHIRLASFIHTTTTLEQSSPVESSLVQELPTALPTVSEPAVGSTSDCTEPVAEQSPIAESPLIDSSQAPAATPENVSQELESPITAALPPILPSTLPFSAEVAANSETEADAPRAAFEVDHFTWPDVCETLLEKRAGEFDQLVGQLVTESALGRKVVAITGSRRGDGRTTLALLLARRLAATAVKVVVVDADFEVPQLAARLGMTIQSGWENVLTDNLPVWDGLVESLGDRMALLPLAPRPAAGAAQQTAAEFVAQHAEAIRKHLDTLRKEFDVVLVDAGVLKAARPDAKPRGLMALAESLDAAIMVSDARMTAPGRIAELSRRMQEAHIVPLGIAENFCPSKPD